MVSYIYDTRTVVAPLLLRCSTKSVLLHKYCQIGQNGSKECVTKNKRCHNPLNIPQIKIDPNLNDHNDLTFLMTPRGLGVI